jgi:hypothetical protein
MAIGRGRIDTNESMLMRHPGALRLLSIRYGFEQWLYSVMVVQAQDISSSTNL